MANPGAKESPPKKEAAVLSNSSLTALSTEVGEKALVLGLCLCVPTTKIVNIDIEAKEANNSSISVAETVLQHWKSMRASAKEKDKVHELEKALRLAGKDEAADILIDKHRDNQELTTELFAQ